MITSANMSVSAENLHRNKYMKLNSELLTDARFLPNSEEKYTQSSEI